MVNRTEICTLVPAAGRGSRLGGNYPKVFTPITDTKTIWDILNEKLKVVSDKSCLILNSSVYEDYKDKLESNVLISFQDDPIGMGDAIFKGYDHFKKSKYLIIVWGDQVHVSQDTLNRVVDSFVENEKQLIIPLVSQKSPYVEYIFNNDKLVSIKQQREGDKTSPGGLSDMGVFGLSVNTLKESWVEYLENQKIGEITGEINFLPFLSFLSFEKNWAVKKIFVDDVDESRGINTKDDLHYFKKIYNGEEDK